MTHPIPEDVADHYRLAARTGTSDCCPPADTRWGAHHYHPDQLAGAPEGASSLSMGCGNPHALADLHPGEVVVDLGSGGGLDVILSARRVAPGGRAYGVDFLPEMLVRARANAEAACVANVEFLLGRIDAVPRARRP